MTHASQLARQRVASLSRAPNRAALPPTEALLAESGFRERDSPGQEALRASDREVLADVVRREVPPEANPPSSLQHWWDKEDSAGTRPGKGIVATAAQNLSDVTIPAREIQSPKHCHHRIAAMEETVINLAPTIPDTPLNKQSVQDDEEDDTEVCHFLTGFFVGCRLVYCVTGVLQTSHVEHRGGEVLADTCIGTSRWSVTSLRTFSVFADSFTETFCISEIFRD